MHRYQAVFLLQNYVLSILDLDQIKNRIRSMNTYIKSIVIAGIALWIPLAASAQTYYYYPTTYTTNTSSMYTEGCYTMYKNPQTGYISILSNNCATNYSTYYPTVTNTQYYYPSTNPQYYYTTYPNTSYYYYQTYPQTVDTTGYYYYTYPTYTQPTYYYQNGYTSSRCISIFGQQVVCY
jgi:hypothetical protein